jgi:hypothetical protein
MFMAPSLLFHGKREISVRLNQNISVEENPELETRYPELSFKGGQVYERHV